MLTSFPFQGNSNKYDYGIIQVSLLKMKRNNHVEIWNYQE